MKWVTNWSHSISIKTNEAGMYGKDITFKYPIYSAFNGSKVRITLDNFTGLQKAHFASVTIARCIDDSSIDVASIKQVTFNGQKTVDIETGERVISDEIDFETIANEKFAVLIYFDDYISLRPAVMTYDIFSSGFYGLGDLTHVPYFDKSISKVEPWVHYLSDVEIYTSDDSYSIMAFGDSITAQSWPSYLNFLTAENHGAVARKAVSGARMLHQYSNLEYQSYGLKSSIRFAHDNIVSGCKAVIILEGVNDLIHPVGVEVNPFRPMSDFPTRDELVDGYKVLIQMARERGLKVLIGTITPIDGWRTYKPFRNERREEINQWIRTTDEIDGYIDFDKLLADPDHPTKMNPIFDSGDHLHPGDAGHKAMAKEAYRVLKEMDLI